MNFPNYWAKDSHTGTNPDGKEVTFAAFGWSSTSIEDAKRIGRERAQRLVEDGFPKKRRTDYDYDGTFFREEVVDSLEVEGENVAVISRNRYGALVLNTDKVMFVDIDFSPTVSTGFWDFIMLTVSPARKAARRKMIEDISFEDVQKWSKKNPSKSFRLYRTHSGLRLLFTDSPYDPKSDESKRILRELMADHLYCSLTERKECYRARLSPKPWRCNSHRPPSSFPWENGEKEEEFRIWEANYTELSNEYSTCIHKGDFGNSKVDSVIQKVIDYHDIKSIKIGKPLA